MLTLFLLFGVIHALDPTKREVQKYLSQIDRIQKRQIGGLLLTMVQMQQNYQELIFKTIEECEAEYSTLQDYHVTQSRNIYHSMQDLQQQLLQYDLLLGTLNHGPQEKEREFYSQQINRLNALINENYSKIDSKEVQLVKMQNMLSQQIDEYDASISVIDSILMTIDSIAKDEQKIGMSFFQKRGKVTSFLDNLLKTNLPCIKVDIPMLQQIILIGIKNNFQDQQTYKQIIDQLYGLRNKLVKELNNLSTDRITQLEQEIESLQSETLIMKQSLFDASTKLQIEKRDTQIIDISCQRIKEELNLLNENLRLENHLFSVREQFLLEEVNELIEISELLQNEELIQFIRK